MDLGSLANFAASLFEDFYIVMIGEKDLLHSTADIQIQRIQVRPQGA
jgi:hypothetical protein